VIKVNKNNENIEPLTAKGVHDAVLSLISSKKGGKVLDAAAGNGAMSKRLSEMGYETFPIDIDASKFQYTKLRCKEVDLNKDIPFEDNFFDLVVSVETIEHLENPWHFIRELHRVLRPGGQLIITTPNITSIFSRLLFLINGRYILFSNKAFRDGHIMPLTKWMIEGILEKNNFTIEKTTCSKGYIPKFKIYFKTENMLLGYILVISAKKI